MNNFGRIFKISIFGESHGPQVGITIDGCPAGLPLSEADFEKDLRRRKSRLRGSTPRKESDSPNLISGIHRDRTNGAPITITFQNRDVRSEDYEHLADIPRPGHADFTALRKFSGFSDNRGGGHFSGRLTVGLVAAGVIAKKIIQPATIRAELIEAGGQKDVDSAVAAALAEGDSIGGTISCEISPVPVGVGEPFFDSVESVISHLIFSIPAVKAIEFGSGFQSARMKGSRHNDCLVDTTGKTDTNFSGGINGGISNGNPIQFRVAVKPTSSISLSQSTINFKTGTMEDLQVSGRHDTCIALRVPVIVEAVSAIALADLMLVEGITARVVKNDHAR